MKEDMPAIAKSYAIIDVDAASHERAFSISLPLLSAAIDAL